MMSNNVRILVVATCVLLGSGHPVLAADTVPVLRGLEAEAGTSGPVVHLHAGGNLDTLHYSPQPGVWVVELPEATWDQASSTLSEPDLGIERAELAHVEEFGKRVSRLTIWLAEPAQLEVVERPGGLALMFSPLTASWREPPSEVVQEEVTPPPTSSIASFDQDTAKQTRAPAPPDETLAENLYEVVPVRSDDGVIIDLKADGVLRGRAFMLEGPDRVVVDLPGVVNRVPRNIFAVGSPLVQRVRVAQFRAIPEPVTRVVVDLEGPVAYDLLSTGGGATVTVGVDTARGVIETTAIQSPVSPIISNTDGAVSVTQSEPAAYSEAVIETAAGPAQTAAEHEVAAASSEVASAVGEVVREASPPPAEDRPKVTPRSPWAADSSQVIERAAAAGTLDLGPSADEFAATEVDTQERQFAGEPIDMRLKDADIRDVLRTFHSLTGINIVVDPGVSGSVTVELQDVPWDQALDLVLRINGLDFVLENNVMRVAPIAKLAQEKKQLAAFQQEQEKALPLRTIFKRLSYAKAGEAAGLLRGDSYLLSDRGSVVVDDRTNTLIIRDTVDRVEGVLRLIEMLDHPTPQVVIEGRIVETTRDFSHELGMGWGFSGIMDAEYGNDTGLRFPNSVTAAGAVGLARGLTNSIAFTFGDILNTFNLDFILGAAETNGYVKIVSTPRVTTQNLQRASIRSGLQIPIQTVANNTVTVQYQDATLQLDVTPQITAEGTVNLELNIKKQEPVTGVAVAGGQNSPIFTRDAQTQLLVRDGGTTVIAGIYQINDQRNENRVPGLSKIPFVKHLFKNKGILKRHDELLIFITPRIVKY